MCQAISQTKEISITLKLTESQAEGLSRLANRITVTELHKLAPENNQAHEILQALWAVKKLLRDAGYDAD